MTETRQDIWPPRDEITSVLLGLYDLKTLEYHCDDQ
ncbi:hypothetical protein F4561_003152 [Lipingzhangella halophila]|uniref:Uncharacterized protein n=1 Tax=Lipingzhangella halophila TaxID=1783352 RepID=A0A7W7RI58_9ACTN|nr:hypothetical protein [Lipingzhangella halophila]